jgi:hypothetical protein
MKIKALPLGIVVLALMFGGILFSMQMNWWKTESERVPAAFKEGDYAGEYDPADIRGSYSFGDINQHFNVPLRDLRVAFGAPEGVDVASFQAKELEEIYSDLADSGTEIGTDSVRLFVALYTGLPFEPGEDTYLSIEAVEILKSKADLSPEQLAYLEAHTVDISASPAEDVKPDTVEEHQEGEKGDEGEEHSTERKVRGPTTFQHVLDWGVSQDTIEGIIGGPMPNPLVAIRDYCFENGLEFGTVKVEMQAAVDAVE